MKGTEVVTNDDVKLGTVVEKRDGYVVVESGHLVKSKHAIPEQFLVEQDGVLRTTLTKEVVHGSPKVGDEWDEGAIRAHYGLDVHYATDPADAEAPSGSPGLEEDFGPADRVRTLGGENDPSLLRPVTEAEESRAEREREREEG